MPVRKLFSFAMIAMLSLVLVSQVQAEDADFYKVPTDSKNGTELVEFIQKIASKQVTSQAELVTLREKGFPAMEQASKAVIALGKNAEPTALLQAKNFLLQIRMAKFPELKQAEQLEVIDQIATDLASDPQLISQAQRIGSQLSRTGQYELAAKAYDKFISALKEGKSPFDDQVIPMFEGAKALVSLPGNKMQVTGKFLDGEAFTWEGYKGKVVLVDFWATWCGPCIAELPHIKELHKKYHVKGFDVLSINLNDTKKEVTDYIAKNPFPWKTVFDAEGENANSKRYGIQSIPTSILIGKDGKVISLNVFSEELAEKLPELLK